MQFVFTTSQSSNTVVIFHLLYIIVFQAASLTTQKNIRIMKSLCEVSLTVMTILTYSHKESIYMISLSKYLINLCH